MLRSLLLLSLGVGVGVAISFAALGAGERPSVLVASAPSKAQQPAAAQATSAARALDQARLLAEVRNVVRDELSARPHGFGADRAETAVESEDDEWPETPTDDEVRAVAQAEELIESARAGQPWTDESAAAFRKQIARVDAALSNELVKSLAVGINRGQIQVTTKGPPI